MSKEQQFLDAARDGDLTSLIRLLLEGVDIEASGVYGETALLSAAYKGCVEVVELLLDAGADIEAKT